MFEFGFGRTRARIRTAVDNFRLKNLEKDFRRNGHDDGKGHNGANRIVSVTVRPISKHYAFDSAPYPRDDMTVASIFGGSITITHNDGTIKSRNLYVDKVIRHGDERYSDPNTQQKDISARRIAARFKTQVTEA